MVTTAMAAFGRVDILVNNAGGSGTVGVADIEDTSEERVGSHRRART